MRLCIAFLIILSMLPKNAANSAVGQGTDSVQDRSARLNVLQNQATWLSMATLLGNPDRYDRKLIRVEGYLHLGEETDALYLHKEDYQAGLNNGIRLDLSYSERDKYRQYDHRYVRMAGKFYSSGPARSIGFGGTLTNLFLVSECQPRQ